ncbi:MAG: pilus assembly protein PilY, partial [Nitrospirota bacterium]|nr:pilus assembly protein PilY [Nitrospirota bacterium]
DITDLENPELLWEFSAPGLGFASTGPAIIRINARSTEYANLPDKDRNGRWFAIFASGPTGPIDTMEHQFKGYSDQNLKLFVVDVKDGTLVRTIDTGITNAFGGSLFNAAADFDIDYQDDVIYIGYTKSEDAEPTAATQWTEGGVIRLVTGEDRRGTASDWANTALNPDNWVWSHVIENTGSTTAAVTHLTSYKKSTITSSSIFFGTGRYFYKGDDSISRRRLYGIKEPCLTAVSSLCARDTSLSSYFCSACLTDTGLTVDNGILTDQTTTVASSADNGWYIDLDNADTEIDAEREITNPLATPQGAVFFTTFAPTTNPCEFGGLTYVWAVDYSTGGALTSGFRIKGLLQVSTGSIEELSEDSFPDAGNRKTLAITGVPPAGQGLTIIMSPPVKNLPLHIRKK